MSRINDALKRAQRAQRQNLSLPGANVPRRLPVQSGPGSAIGWILPGVIGFLIVAACLFIGMALITRTATKAANRPNLVAAQPATSAPAAAPVRAPTPAPAAAPPPLASAQPPPPPEPKLQGIVYAATGAWAIVDGQTVHAGDRLGDFRVKEISPRNVTLEKADGSQKKLGLDK